MAVMNEVIDSRAFSNFCGINSPDEVPNGDTIGRFRNILTRNGLQEKIFADVVNILVNKGLILKKGTIVDSTFIESPSSIKKLSKSGQYAAKKREYKKSSVRCKVEDVFSVVKNIFKYRKTRYRGLRKQTAKLNIMFALANLYLADRKSLTV
jgi:IS5 family transposase